MILKELTKNSDVVVYKLLVNGFYKWNIYNAKAKTINGLEADTEYAVKIEATNYKQNKLIREIKFRTLSNYILSDFKVNATTIKACSAIITWGDCTASDGRAISYSVYDNNLKIKSGLTVKQFELTNLEPNTKYTYKIVAYPYEHYPSKESFVTFTTNKTAVPSDFNVSISEITDKSACVSWDASKVIAEEEYNKYISYELTVNGNTIKYSSNKSKLNIENLLANVEYEAVVKATSYYGEVKISRKIFRTLPTKVYHINLKATNSTQRTISLAWDFDNNPLVESYDLYINGVRDGLATPGFSYIFKGLISNTEYSFRLVAKNNAGRVVDEKTIKASTVSYTNIGDFDIKIDAGIYSKVLIDISDLENKYGKDFKAEGYTTKYYIDDNRQYSASDYLNNKEINGLKSSTKYVLKLEIYNPDGTLAYSFSKDFTTDVNTAPLWKAQPFLVKVNGNQIDISNAYAVDKESGVYYKYYFNGKVWTGGLTSSKQTINEQVDVGANQGGKLIKLSHFRYNTNYSFYIIAVDAEGKETKSSVVNFKTTQK